MSYCPLPFWIGSSQNTRETEIRSQIFSRIYFGEFEIPFTPFECQGIFCVIQRIYELVFWVCFLVKDSHSRLRFTTCLLASHFSFRSYLLPPHSRAPVPRTPGKLTPQSHAPEVTLYFARAWVRMLWISWDVQKIESAFFFQPNISLFADGSFMGGGRF